MAFKDLLVNYAKTQTCLAVTAMKVSVRSVTIQITLLVEATCCLKFFVP